MSEPEPTQRKINPWSVWIPIIIIVLAVVVTYNWMIYLEMKAREEKAGRPPYISRVEDDLILTERSGKQVRMSELRGKIILASWVFTRCPRGCAGVVAKMKKLSEEYANNKDVHFICFALDPEDTPEMLAAFADQVGVAKDAAFWFVNGDEKAVREYMTRQFMFRPVEVMPEKDRLTPEDKYMHDLRVAVVDEKGNVRRLADLVNADPEVAAYWDQQIRADIEFILNEKKKNEG